MSDEERIHQLLREIFDKIAAFSNRTDARLDRIEALLERISERLSLLTMDPRLHALEVAFRKSPPKPR